MQESSEKCGTLLPALIRRTLSPALFRRTLSPTLFESHPASEKGERPFRLRFTKDKKEKNGLFESSSLANKFFHAVVLTFYESYPVN
jgi:hypothetical protein